MAEGGWEYPPYGREMTAEEKQLHRIEKLLEANIKLSMQILTLVRPHYNPTTAVRVSND